MPALGHYVYLHVGTLDSPTWFELLKDDAYTNCIPPFYFMLSLFLKNVNLPIVFR